VPGTSIVIDFKDGALSANAGCNQIGGDFEIRNGKLVLGNQFTTAMGCDAARADQDTWLMRLLGSTPAVTLVADQLTIDGGSAVLHLVDRRVAQPDRPISGPTWTVDSIFAAETVSSVPNGVVATLVFHADGSLDVAAGCNHGSGRWKGVAGGIEVDDLALTKMACAGPAGELETAVLSVLTADSIAATIHADQLILQAGARGIGLRAR
jgi:heat shock protein HslJ